MKRHVEELSHVYECLVKDIAYALPSLAGELERDLKSLRKFAKARGLPFFTVDLVELGKHLDQCLSASKYVPSRLPCSRSVSDGVVIPKLFRGLYLLIFSESGCLKDQPCSLAVQLLRQCLYTARKTTVDCTQEAKDLAVKSFAELDASLPEPDRFWDDPTLPAPTAGFMPSLQENGNNGIVSKVASKMDTVSNLATCALGPYRLQEFRFKHGPGAVSNLRRSANKYCWTNWSDRLEASYPIADCGFHSWSSWARGTEDREIGSDEPSSRLICVPKTIRGPRLIAAEPSEHQWCQQNLWAFMESGVERSWLGRFIRFRDQTFNQKLCLRGSVDGSLATIDLSSASDRVTCAHVSAMFRCNPHLLRSMAACRTHSVQLPCGQIVRMKKYATMGNATTFPVQSLVFLCMALSTVLTVRGLEANRKNIERLAGEVAVFGDDIIIPKDSQEVLVQVLHAFGMKVNIHKSFLEGNFRESCGVDAFQGRDVTPVYWKEPCTGKPESVATNVAVHNNLIARYYMHTACHVATTVPRFIARVHPDSGVFGLHCRTKISRHAYRHRYNQNLQRDEVRIMTTSSHIERVRTEDDTSIFQYFTERPSRTILWSAGYGGSAPLVKLKRAWVPWSNICCSAD